MLPETGEEALAHQGNVGRPSGILREYPLFGTDAVEQGCPPRHHQQRCAEIPFLEVVTNVRKHIGQIHRMAHEPVWTSRCETPQGRPDSEPFAHTEEAGEAQTRPERHKHQPTRRPRRVAGHPPEIRHLGIRVGIGYDDGGAGEQRAILHLRRGPREGDPKNQEML